MCHARLYHVNQGVRGHDRGKGRVGQDFINKKPGSSCGIVGTGELCSFYKVMIVGSQCASILKPTRDVICIKRLHLLKSQDANIISGHEMSDSDEFMSTALSPAQAIYVEGAYVGQQGATARASSEPQVGDVGIKKQSWQLCQGCTGVGGSWYGRGSQDAKGIVCRASSAGVSLEPESREG
jgi:hypothetical protein